IFSGSQNEAHATRESPCNFQARRQREEDGIALTHLECFGSALQEAGGSNPFVINLRVTLSRMWAVAVPVSQKGTRQMAFSPGASNHRNVPIGKGQEMPSCDTEALAFFSLLAGCEIRREVKGRSETESRVLSKPPSS
ncbi:UNVERIFIED_CONTAM: hypothetical protein K2H54_075973, partial [Gekko kuhli]